MRWPALALARRCSHCGGTPHAGRAHGYFVSYFVSYFVLRSYASLDIANARPARDDFLPVPSAARTTRRAGTGQAFLPEV